MSSNGGGARILIVDDEPQIRRFLSASLSSHEYTVIEAHTGNEAIRLCTTAQPDLVILDLGLPDLDGREVLSRIREWSRVPVIVLSVRFDEQDKIDALDRGADDYVTKPFSMGELLARMRDIENRDRLAELAEARQRLGRADSVVREKMAQILGLTGKMPTFSVTIAVESVNVLSVGTWVVSSRFGETVICPDYLVELQVGMNFGWVNAEPNTVGSGTGFFGTSVRIDAQGRIVAATNDVPAFYRLVPAAAQRSAVRLFEVQPTDESLTSVFSYLVEK